MKEKLLETKSLTFLQGFLLWEIQTPNSHLYTLVNTEFLKNYVNLGAYLGAYMPKTL